MTDPTDLPTVRHRFIPMRHASPLVKSIIYLPFSLDMGSSASACHTLIITLSDAVDLPTAIRVSIRNAAEGGPRWVRVTSVKLV